MPRPHGPCFWPGCPDKGFFYTGRTVGLEKKWGYACEAHERVISAENEENAGMWRRRKEPVLDVVTSSYYGAQGLAVLRRNFP